MRFGILSLLFAACLSFAQSQRPPEKTDQSQASQGPSKIDFWFLPSDPDPNTAKKQQSTHNEPRYGDLATWALVIVGIGGVGAALWTLAIIRRQTRAIEQQGDALMNSERSWVMVDIDQRMSTPQAPPGITRLHVQVWNAGKTPARVTHRLSQLRPIGSLLELPNTPTYTNSGTPCNEMLAPVPPKSVGTFSIDVLLTLDQITFDAIENGSKLLYGDGRIEYRDTFSNERHTTFGFCWHRYIDGDPFSGRWVREGPESYSASPDI